MENNRLIAEFMNLEKFGFKNKNYLVLGKHLSPTQLPYKTSWNWLMEVVEKIENLTDKSSSILYDFTIFSDAVLIANQEEDEIVLVNKTDAEFNTKIEATYKAIVKFIEWYNTNKKL